ncbi:MAG: hypothetical protein ABI175_01285 [Polyangiales bacterium]
MNPRLVRVCALAGLALVVSLFFWWPMIDALPGTQGGDGPVFYKMFEAARVSMTRYHEFPLWNPYECGGLPLWDNPQAPFGSPLTWPMYFIGTTKTVAFWYIAHSAIGFASMWLLMRVELETSRAAAFVSAGAFAFCGFFQNHLPGGHLVFASFEYFPLAVLFWRRAEHDLRMAIGLGLVVAMMIYEGGIYPIPHLAVFLAVETLTRLWPVKRFPKVAVAGLVVLAVAISVGAARFLPVIDQVKSHTRGVAIESDGLHWGVFKEVFILRSHERPVTGQRYVWGEYGMYIGVIIVGLALLGMILSGARHLWLLLLLATTLIFMFGDVSPKAPWTVLRAHVFPFKDMRVPSRFGFEVTMVLTMFAGLGVDRIVALARKHLRSMDWVDAVRIGVIGLGMIGVGDIIAVGTTLVAGSFGGPAEDTKIVPSPKLYLGSRSPNMIDGPRENLGRIACWEEWGFGVGAPLWEGDVPQARTEADTAVVDNVVRTPNYFTVDVTATAPTRLLFNTSWDKGWRSTVGTALESNKQLAVDIPPGTHHLVVRYRPPTFNLGVTLTTIGTLGSIAALIWLSRRRRKSASPVS